MPLYELEIKKRLSVGTDLRDWSNNYHVEAGDLAEALTFATAISNIEQAVHKDYVMWTYANAREAITDPPPGASIALTGAGDVTGDDTLRLPPFNTVRCMLSDGNGRPSQKFLRLPLEEGDVLSGALTSAIINSVQLDYLTDLLALPYLRSNSGNEFTSATVATYVQMRQTNWNRRTRPGFHRGWVPD